MSTVHFEISYIAGFVINNGVFAPNECKDRTWCIFIPSETRSVIVHFAFSRLMQIRDTGRRSTTASKPALHFTHWQYLDPVSCCLIIITRNRFLFLCHLHRQWHVQLNGRHILHAVPLHPQQPTCALGTHTPIISIAVAFLFSIDIHVLDTKLLPPNDGQWCFVCAEAQCRSSSTSRATQGFISTGPYSNNCF